MTFSDEDLKRLKEYVHGNKGYNALAVEGFDLSHLIARLEAAEVIAEDHGSIYPNDPAVCRWRKAAGK